MKATKKGEIAFMLAVLDVKHSVRHSDSLISAANNLATAKEGVARAAREVLPHLTKLFSKDAPTKEELEAFVHEIARTVNQV